MPNNKAFQEKIIELQKLIQLFSKNYNSDIDTDFKELNEQLLDLSKVTIPFIKSFAKKETPTGDGIYNSAPNGESETSDIDSDTDDTCSITNTKTLEPVEYKRARRFVFPKGFILFEIETSTSTCSIDDLEKKIVFSNGNEEPVDFNIISREGKKIKVSVPIDFTGQVAAEGKRLSAEVKIKYHSTESIYYIPNANVKTSTDKETEETIENFVRWSKTISVDGSPSAEQITSICPSIKITKNSVLVTDLERELRKIPFVLKMQAADLKALDFASLESAAKEALSIFHSILKKLLSAVSYYNDILIGLGSLAYPSPKKNETADEKLARETKLAKANKGLRSEYDKQCANSRKLLETINNKMTLVSDIRTLIIAELIAKSIPEALVTQSNALKEMRTAQDLVLKPLVDEVYGYYSKATALDSFEEWKAMLDRINPICDQLQTAWDTPWNALNTAISTYETSNPEGAKNSYYEQWKESDYNSLTFHLHSQKGPVLSDIDNIKSYLKTIQEAVDKTDGDGTMEFSEGEDKASNAEKTLFKDKTIATTFDFENTGKPVFDHGPQKEDVQQGQVGDCYLMSALISLTKDNTDLIRSMIDDQGDKCIVTLHQGGVPVKVEVSKKLMVKKMDGYLDSTPPAQHDADIWVAIIEKAYAKLLGSDSIDPGGDLTKITGGSTTQALEVLLGNRVKTPEEIYLDNNGSIVQENPTETIANPIILSAISIDALKRVVQAANESGYEIHTSSPDKYKGYTLGDHDILPIDEHHYMSFDHAYSLINATATTVTIRNPHGNSEKEQGLFSEQVKTDVTLLMKAAKAVSDNFNANTAISSVEKTALAAAINGVSNNTLIVGRFRAIIKDWNDWVADLIQDATDEHKWKPIPDLKARKKKKLGTQISTLYADIITIANRADKDNKLQDGFLSKTVRLSAEQTITYEVLKEYFERVNLSLISV